MTNKIIPPPRHQYHSSGRRGIYCVGLVSGVLLAGTVGIHYLERFSFIDSFYFIVMIATGQGPPPSIAPVTAAGKLFTCFIAIVSVGVMVASLGFLFGPFLGKLWKVGVLKFEEEVEFLKHKNSSTK